MPVFFGGEHRRQPRAAALRRPCARPAVLPDKQVVEASATEGQFNREPPQIQKERVTCQTPRPIAEVGYPLVVRDPDVGQSRVSVESLLPRARKRRKALT